MHKGDLVLRRSPAEDRGSGDMMLVPGVDSVRWWSYLDEDAFGRPGI